jgi:hypothetical protein
VKKLLCPCILFHKRYCNRYLSRGYNDGVLYSSFVFMCVKGLLAETYVRPWLSPVPPLPQSVDIVERYPSDDEENGMVLIGWRGPLAKV